MAASTFAGSNIIIGVPAYLFVVLRCNNCANTRLLDATVMGDIFLRHAPVPVSEIVLSPGGEAAD